MDPVVVIRPLSGYVNRLQAIVSAKLLADDVGAQLWIDWRPSDVTPVGMDNVLDPEFCQTFGRSVDEVTSLLGMDPAEMPPYLAVDPQRRVITLAGQDRGEQTFMPSLRNAWSSRDFDAIAISAGGKFSLDGGQQLTAPEAAAFRLRRRDAYRWLPLHPGIEDLAAAAMTGHGPFLALHLRYSDRSLESPWSWEIAPSLGRLKTAMGIDELFIASDTPQARDRWIERTGRMGLQPWSTTPPALPRSDPRSAWGALVDWRILSRSFGAVYFAASSFAEEAVVASGHDDQSIPLTSTRSRRAWMHSRQWVRAAVTYPRRHGWIRR